MRPHIRNLIDTFATDLLAEERLANEAAELATLAREDGNEGFAGVVLSLSRQHRIKALELRGQLAALANKYPHALSTED
jgi:hypothetical protein